MHKKPSQDGLCDRCGGTLTTRADDNETTVRNRLEVYHKQTAPVMDHYRRGGTFQTVDGMEKMDVVFDALCRIVQP